MLSPVNAISDLSKEHFDGEVQAIDVRPTV
jgi:hypothetical protein